MERGKERKKEGFLEGQGESGVRGTPRNKKRWEVNEILERKRNK